MEPLNSLVSELLSLETPNNSTRSSNGLHKKIQDNAKQTAIESLTEKMKNEMTKLKTINEFFSSIETQEAQLDAMIRSYNYSKNDDLQPIIEAVNTFSSIFRFSYTDLPYNGREVNELHLQMLDKGIYYRTFTDDFKAITNNPPVPPVVFFGPATKPQKNYQNLVEAFNGYDGFFRSPKEWNRRVEICHSSRKEISRLSEIYLKHTSELMKQFIQNVEQIRNQTIPDDSAHEAKIRNEADILEAYIFFSKKRDLSDWDLEQKDPVLKAIDLAHLIPFTKNKLEEILLCCKDLDSTRLNKQSNELDPVTNELIESNRDKLIFITLRFSIYCKTEFISYFKEEQTDLFDLLKQIYTKYEPWKIELYSKNSVYENISSGLYQISQIRQLLN